MTTVSDVCVTVPLIVASGYQSKGTDKSTTKGLKYYETHIGSKTDAAIVVVYDVVGPGQPNTQQQADRVSEALGVKVVIPDYYNTGGGFPKKFGPGGATREDLYAWIASVASDEQIVERTEDILKTLRSEGVQRFGVFGFCWGGAKAETFGHWSDKEITFSATGFVHATTFTPDHAKGTLIPVINLPSSSEGDQSEYIAALPAGIKERSVYKHYKDVPHGWAAARGDWTDPLKKQRAEEVIQDLADFFQKNVVSPS